MYKRPYTALAALPLFTCSGSTAFCSQRLSRFLFAAALPLFIRSGFMHAAFLHQRLYRFFARSGSTAFLDAAALPLFCTNGSIYIFLHVAALPLFCISGFAAFLTMSGPSACILERVYIRCTRGTYSLSGLPLAWLARPFEKHGVCCSNVFFCYV